MKTLLAKRRSVTFIQLTREQIVERITSHITKIRSSIGNDSMHIAFTVGFDATCLVQGWKLSASHGAIVGGVIPNHFISVGERIPEQVKELLKE